MHLSLMIDTATHRLGNVILDEEYQLFLVETEAELLAIQEVPEDFHTLPITEYRLREMGFIMNNEPDQLDMYFMHLLYFGDLNVTVNPVWTIDRFTFSMPDHRMMPIKFIHQLQNLISIIPVRKWRWVWIQCHNKVRKLLNHA